MMMVAMLYILGTVPAAGEELDELDRRKRFEWLDSKYHIMPTIQLLKDSDTQREAGPGFQLEGPNPFRTLNHMDPKLIGNWRLGANWYEYNIQDSLGRVTSTKLKVLTASVGYDYMLQHERPQSIFLSMYVTSLIPYRDKGLQGRTDKTAYGLSLGFGWQARQFRIRYEHGFMHGRTKPDTLGIGYQF